MNLTRKKTGKGAAEILWRDVIRSEQLLPQQRDTEGWKNRMV